MSKKEYTQAELDQAYLRYLQHCTDLQIRSVSFKDFEKSLVIEKVPQDFIDAGDVESGRLITNFDLYQEMTARTAGEFESKKEELVAWSMGIAGEAGEYVDGIKKHVFHGHVLDDLAQAKELGDTLFYLARSAAALGYTLSEIATMNIEKLEKRYPKGFDKERSINREENKHA